MATGTIKKVVADRGFGFIAAEDEKEYFFHRGGLDSSLDFDRLQGGERVEWGAKTIPRSVIALIKTSVSVATLLASRQAD